MENKDFGYVDFNYYCEKVLNPDKDISVDDMIKIHTDLKHIEVSDIVNIIDSGKMLLYCLLGKSYHDPYYEEVQKEFLASDYVSTEMKEILSETIGENCSLEVKELLNNTKHFNNYSSSEIESIVNELVKGAKASLLIPRIALVNYMFMLDGEGPTEYIKKSNSEKALALLILQHSGVCTRFSDTDDVLYEDSFGVNHLLSIYEKYNKYMPDKKEAYVDFVNNINYLTEYNFVENYSRFINNGFNSEFSYIDNTEWLKRLNESEQTECDFINDNMHFLFNSIIKEKALKLKQS